MTWDRQNGVKEVDRPWPPRSVKDALVEREELGTDILDIQTQLSIDKVDPRDVPAEDRARWRAKARGAVAFKVSRLKRLKAWLIEHHQRWEGSTSRAQRAADLIDDALDQWDRSSPSHDGAIGFLEEVQAVLTGGPDDD